MATNDSTWQMKTVKPWLLLVLAAACSREVAGGAADGVKVYQEVCASCHGPSGTPSEAMGARLGVKDLNAPDVRERLTHAAVAAQIRNGSPNKLMPAFAGALTEAQIEAVAAYVMAGQISPP
jgi:mono/diheme cytochrome c family protein